MVCWWKQIGQLGATRPRGKPSEGRSVACSCCLALLFFDIQPSLPTEPRALSLSEKSCIVRIASPFEHRSRNRSFIPMNVFVFFFLSLSLESFHFIVCRGIFIEVHRKELFTAEKKCLVGSFLLGLAILFYLFF